MNVKFSTSVDTMRDCVCLCRKEKVGCIVQMLNSLTEPSAFMLPREHASANIRQGSICLVLSLMTSLLLNSSLTAV